MPEKLWTKNYVLALLLGFLLSLIFYLLLTSMALYAIEEFGAGDTVAGLAASIFTIGAIGARLGAGVAADRFGRRRVLVVSLVLATLATLTYFPADELTALLAVRMIHGLAFGTSHTAASAITQSLIPQSRRAEGTGYHGATTTLGTAVGPFLAVLFVNNYGYDGVFVTSTVVSFLALGVGIRLRVPQDLRAAATVGRRGRRWPIEVAAVPISTFILVCAIAFSGVVAFVNPFATSLELTSAAAGFFIFYAAAVLVLRPFAGRLQDARGPSIVIYPALLVFAMGLATLALTHDGAMLLVAAVLIGVGWGSLMSAAQAIAVTSAPIANVGRTVSTYFLLVDVGLGLGPVALGALVGYLDYRWMYGVLAGLILFNGFYYRAVHSRSTRG